MERKKLPYAKHLKLIRQELNLTVAQLAQKLEMSPRTLLAYEREERTPSIELTSNLKEKLSIDTNWFLSGDGKMFLEHDCEYKPKETVYERNFKVWGERLKIFLEINGIERGEFASVLGVSEERANEMIDNSANPTLGEINSMKYNFEVVIDWLLYGEEGARKVLSLEDVLKLKTLALAG